MADPIVVLRPFAEADLDYFDAGVDPETDPYNWVGFRPPGQIRREFARTGLFGDEHVSLAVEVDGELAGETGWHVVQHGPPESGKVFEIGLTLRPEFRGRGLGTRAQQQLAEYLFAVYPVHRIEALTDIENIAEQLALERAGFTREGVLRGLGWRTGAWRDAVLYSRLRTD